MTEQSITMRRRHAALAVVLIGVTLAGRSSRRAAQLSVAPAPYEVPGGPSSSPVGNRHQDRAWLVYFIPKDTQNPYEVLADEGGATALKELGGNVVVSSGTADTAAAQIPSIQAAIQAHADAIVIAGNDPSALCPSLGQAAAAGIKIVSSTPTSPGRPDHLFINQANTR